ncbi:MAG: hypothetical protein ACYC35_04695 [Pirellulales bacterium]
MEDERRNRTHLILQIAGVADAATGLVIALVFTDLPLRIVGTVLCAAGVATYVAGVIMGLRRSE